MSLRCNLCGFKSDSCHILKCPRCNSNMVSESCGSCKKCNIDYTIMGFFSKNNKKRKNGT